MTRLWIHPEARTIGAFACGDLTGSARARTAAHLADCAHCRGEVTAIRALLADARALPAPRPAAATLERALARRAAGERLVLPALDPPGPPERRAVSPRHVARALPAIAAVALLAIAALLLGRTPPLAAGALTGELQLVPAHPRPGAEVRVAYWPSARLAGAAGVRLRARMRTATTVAPPRAIPSVAAAVLQRDADGVYRGSFRLPDSVVYAALVVEDTTATHVDSHLERLWDLLVADADSAPRLDAMRAQIADALPRDWEAALVTARRMVRLHPDRAESWQTRFMMEAELAGAARMDSLRAVYRPTLHRLHDALRGAPAVPSVEMRAMWRWANAMREDSIAAHWAGRLRREAPKSAAASELLQAELAALPPAARLVQLEALWASPGRDAPPSALPALLLATQLGDTAAIRRWGARVAAEEPVLAGMVASQFAEVPALRAEGMERLRAALTTLAHPDDARRPLEQGRAADSTRRAGERLGLLAALGRALLADGRVRAARDTLVLATAEGWDPGAFASLGDARLQLGDTVGAMRAHALAAADAGTSTDSVLARRARLGVVAGAAWDAALADARARMRERVLASSMHRVLSASPQLADSVGKLHRLSSIAGGRVTLVAFWSRYCGPALSDLAALQRVARELQGDGVRVVAVTAEPPSPALRGFLRDRKLTFATYHDVRGEARLAFGAHGTPLYYVLDAHGVVRFRPGSPVAVPRLAAALRE